MTLKEYAASYIPGNLAIEYRNQAAEKNREALFFGMGSEAITLFGSAAAGVAAYSDSGSIAAGLAAGIGTYAFTRPLFRRIIDL